MTRGEARREERAANGHRAIRGGDIVQFYSDENGHESEPFRDVAVDAIADILHALKRRGLDPESAHGMAWRHYAGERAAGGQRT